MDGRCCREIRWVEVVDATGRPRLEMRWAVPSTGAAAPASRAA